MERQLLGLVAVGVQPGQEVRQECLGPASVTVLDLADVLELVVDALDERPLAQQLAGIRQPPLMHVRASSGDQPGPLGGEELPGERLGDGSPVPKGLAEAALSQLRRYALWRR